MDIDMNKVYDREERIRVEQENCKQHSWVLDVWQFDEPTSVCELCNKKRSEWEDS